MMNERSDKSFATAPAKETIEVDKLFSQIGFGATFFDAIPSPVLILNRKGDIFASNDSFCKHFGFDGSELLEKNWRELVDADEHEIEEYLTNFFQSEEFDLDIRYRFDENIDEVFHIESFRLENDRGYIALFHKQPTEPETSPVATARNNDVRKNGIAEFNPAERLYEQLLELAPCPVFITDTNLDFKFVNKAACSFLGYDRDEMLAKNVADLKRPEAAKRLMEFRKNRDQSGIEIQKTEWEYLRKDGSWVWGESNVRILPGRLCIAFVEDISQRKEKEKLIRQAQERYKFFIAHSGQEISRFEFENPIPIDLPVKDQVELMYNTGLLVECNDLKAKHYGFDTVDEVIGKPFKDFVNSKERIETVLQAFIASNYKLNNRETIENDEKGNEKHYSTSLIGTIKDNNLTRIWGTQRDITAQKRAEKAYLIAEEQLRQSQKIEPIGRLAGGIAHDFNNFLAVIMLQVDMINQQLSNDDPLRLRINEIKTVTDNAARMVKQLLAFGRKQTLQPRPVVLNDVVEEFIKIIRTLIGEDIEIKLTLDSDLGVCFVDPNQITQVLMNLAVNARDAMSEGGVLKISSKNLTIDENTFKHKAQPKGSYIELSVSDNGSGMDSKTKKHIFEPFFTTKEAHKGTGLGLATVYGIIKQSKGFIWVDSKIDEGATFTVHFPRTDKVARIVKQKKVISIPQGTETILLVEDEKQIRKSSKEVLESLGYTIIDAKDGEQAIETAENYEGEIHLLLTDVVMPKMNGRELAREIKSLHPESTILFMSGYADDIISRHGILEEDVHFLGKPFSPLTLAVSVRNALEK